MFPAEALFLQVVCGDVLGVWMSEILTSLRDSLTVTWCCVLSQMWLTHKQKYRRCRNKKHIGWYQESSVFLVFLLWFSTCVAFTKVTQLSQKCPIIFVTEQKYLFTYKFYSFDIRTQNFHVNVGYMLQYICSLTETQFVFNGCNRWEGSTVKMSDIRYRYQYVLFQLLPTVLQSNFLPFLFGATHKLWMHS